MLSIKDKINLLVKLGTYFDEMDEALENAIENAHRNNAWFTPAFMTYAINTIKENYLQKEKIEEWLKAYPLVFEQKTNPKTVGLVMAGNIPLVGFHDFLCVFLSGQKQLIKLSSKDTVFWQHILEKLSSWNPEFQDYVQVSVMLKNCDAYIATGSNNSARYFDYYFKKYAHIIRRNRSSVAVLDGTETDEDLEKLADDINIYFGLGCRNVTQIFVPKDYNFEKLIQAMNKYKDHIDHNKFKNNFDYQLALYLLNRTYYMTNGHILFIESDSIYAPISVVHYQYYEGDKALCIEDLLNNDSVQCINVKPSENINPQTLVFGQNQIPSLSDYADGVDTMTFLLEL
ncbi:MAG TPA: acyl-CoA reductase [Edaphocola sp.]|nr:acyl-CoA reductase [Edaphocola sp.]